MEDKNVTSKLSRRSVLSSIGATTVASGLSAAQTSGESTSSGAESNGIAEEKKAFGHEQVKQYADPQSFLSAIEAHTSALIQGMYNDGYITTPKLTTKDLGRQSSGLIGVPETGEYGAWFRHGEPKLVVKLPSDSHEINLHVRPESGEVFADLDSEYLIKSVEETDDGDLTTQSCEICDTYVECQETCDTCQCDTIYQYGEKRAEEYYCCCSACGCNDCGYLGDEYCSEQCCADNCEN